MAAEDVVIVSGVSIGNWVEVRQQLLQTASDGPSSDAWNGGLAVTVQDRNAQRGQGIAVLANPVALCADTNVREGDLSLLQSGDNMQICFEDGSSADGEVAFVSYIAGANGTFSVQIAPVQPLENVILGQSAAIISARNE